MPDPPPDGAPLGGAVVHLNSLPEYHDSVVCLSYRGERPFLVRHRHRGWEFPGGHSEPGESLWQTARREALEEAGASLSEQSLIGYYVLSGGHVTVVTHAQVEALAPLTGEFETVEARAFARLPGDEELSWADGLYAHLIRAAGLPGAPEQDLGTRHR